MIKTNIKMRVTPEQSIKVQEICFKNGINWGYLDDIVRYEDEPYIFIDKKNYLAWLGEDQNDNFMRAKEEEIDPELFIRTSGTCENKDFNYPMWFKNKNQGYVVRFDGLTIGEVIYGFESWYLGSVQCVKLTAHTDDSVWQQVENPNKELDKLDDDLINEMEEYEYQKPIQYQIGIDTFQRAKANLTKDELIACIKFNIDKYNWRKKGQDIEDFKKIIDYANFAIEVLRGEK